MNKIDVEGLRAKVKPLEWEAVTDQIPKHAFAAYTAFGRWLIVCEFLSMNHMVYRFNSVDYDTIDEAKAAAQADYATRILSAVPALLDRIAELEAALRPLADEATVWHPEQPDETPVFTSKAEPPEGDAPSFTIGDFRLARTTLSGAQS